MLQVIYKNCLSIITLRDRMSFADFDDEVIDGQIDIGEIAAQYLSMEI
jgi:hypothetical protein